MKISSFSYSLYACLLLAWTQPSAVFANDNDQALYWSIYIEPASYDGNSYGGETYDWQQPAWDNGTYRFDTFVSSSGYSVTVKTLLDAPGLGTVQGDWSMGSVDGYLNNGTYGDSHVQSGESWDYNQETWDYTVDFAQGQLSWVHRTIYSDGMYNSSDDWDDSNGQWGMWSSSSYEDGMNSYTSESWSDSTGVSGSHEWGNSTMDSMSGSDMSLLGIDYTYGGGSSWYDNTYDNVNGTLNTSSSSEYYSSYDGSSSMTVVNTNTYDGTNSVNEYQVDGSDSYLGAFHYYSTSADSSAGGWAARTAPSFAPSSLWIDGWLVSWQSGVLADDGTVTDTYEDAEHLFSIVVAGNVRDFALGNTSATVLVQGNAAGSLDSNGTWALSGWSVATQAPQQASTTLPFFLPDVTSLWLNESEYPFVASYTDSNGNYLDVYQNQGLGTILLAGQATGSAQVVGNRNTAFFTGSLANGEFTLPEGLSILLTTPVPAFDPAPLWVRGVLYNARVLIEGVPSNTFLDNDGVDDDDGSLTFSDDDGDGIWDIQGTDPSGKTFAGTITATTTGVFLLQETDTAGLPLADGLLFAARQVDSNDDFQGAGGTPEDTSMPAAVSLQGDILVYLGTSAEDAASAQQVAWYGQMAAASCQRVLKIVQGGTGAAAVMVSNYADGTAAAGSYDPDIYLFQTSATADSLPSPLYSADATAGHTRLLLTPTESTLPASFIVRGQSWWYAGEDENNTATYRGFYTGQEMTLTAADPDSYNQREVTLTDSTYNNGATTHGTLSSERKSVRLRDGTLVLSGTEIDGESATITHVDDYKLNTIAADLDIVGNNISFGILQGDASLAGALFQFADDSSTAGLHSILSRSQTQWGWWKEEGLDGDTVRPVMWLDAGHRINLYQSGSYDAPAIVLDPAGTSSFKGPVRVPESGDIPMGIYNEGDPP